MPGALPDPDAAALAKEAGALAFAAGRLDDALKSYTGRVVPLSRSSSLTAVPQEVFNLAQLHSHKQEMLPCGVRQHSGWPVLPCCWAR